MIKKTLIVASTLAAIACILWFGLTEGRTKVGDSIPHDPQYTQCSRNLPNIVVNGSFYLDPRACGWAYEDHFGNARRNWQCNSTWDCYYEIQAQTAGNTWDTQLMQPMIPIKAGQTYMFHMEIWTDTAGAPVHIELRNGASPWNLYAHDFNATLYPAVKQVLTSFFTANSTTMAGLNVMIGQTTATYRISRVWFEEVQTADTLCWEDGGTINPSCLKKL